MTLDSLKRFLKGFVFSFLLIGLITIALTIVAIPLYYITEFIGVLGGLGYVVFLICAAAGISNVLDKEYS